MRGGPVSARRLTACDRRGRRRKNGSPPRSRRHCPADEAPHLVKEAPHLVKEQPHLVKEQPHLVEEAPHIVEEAPHIVEEAPHLFKEAPLLCQGGAAITVGFGRVVIWSAFRHVTGLAPTT